jgi:hypothetical protein
MPLRTDFNLKLRVQLGLTAPPIATQLKQLGLELLNPEIWEQRHLAWNLLRLGGFISDHEAELVAGRLIKALGQEAAYAKGLVSLRDEVYESIDTTQTADVTRVLQSLGCTELEPEPQPETDSANALDTYLKERDSDS